MDAEFLIVKLGQPFIIVYKRSNNSAHAQKTFQFSYILTIECKLIKWYVIKRRCHNINGNVFISQILLQNFSQNEMAWKIIAY
jgi:hypothetical protein